MLNQLKNYFKKSIDFISVSSSLLWNVFVLNKKLNHTTNPRSKECLIIGNGPSFQTLFEDNPNFFSNKDLICVNHFPNTAFFEKLEPQYWVLRDSAFWRHGTKDVYTNTVEETLEAVVKKTTWNLILLVPTLAVRHSYFINKLKKNTNIQLVFYNPIAIPPIKWISNRLYQWNIAMPFCINVIGATIYTMINNGYSSIYLTGVESDFHTNFVVTHDNDFGIYDIHFYDKDKKDSFISFKKVLEKPYLVYQGFYDCYLCFKMYTDLQKYAISQKVIIQNTTLNSFIDAFPKIKITPTAC